MDNTRPATPPVSLRPIRIKGKNSDLPFLNKLYASTRAAEMLLSGWNREQIDAFILDQFIAQHSYYLKQFKAASFDLITTEDGTPIGRFYVEKRKQEYRIIDISLLPSHQNKGIGEKLIKNTLNKAFKSNRTVRIHVENNNPAMSLYRRLGFKLLEDKGAYYLMEATRPS